jgi:hypothetical protein
MRLRAAGYRLSTCPDVSVVHLGNAKTLRHFFRQQFWHSLSMFGTVTARSLDRPTAMLALHLPLTLAGIALLVSGSWRVRRALAAAGRGARRHRAVTGPADGPASAAGPRLLLYGRSTRPVPTGSSSSCGAETAGNEDPDVTR